MKKKTEMDSEKRSNTLNKVRPVENINKESAESI